MTELKHVRGLSELQKMLDTLPAKIEQNILRGALRKGANVIRDEAKNQLQSHGNVKTGKLMAGLKVSTRSRRGVVTASMKAKGEHGYIAYWIEFTGAAPHTITSKNGLGLRFGGQIFRSIEHPGFQAKPFMRPALDSKAGQAVVAVGNEVKARLTKSGIDAAAVEIEEV